MSTPSFDLVDVIHTLRSRRRFVFTITLVAAVVAAVLHFVLPKKYEAQGEFILANPVYSDRNNLYGDTHFIDYFADEDAVDRVISMAESDTVSVKIINAGNLGSAYNLDPNKPADIAALKQKLQKNLSLKRTEYKDAKLSYVDTDPVRAANIANISMQVIGNAFGGYYTGIRQHMAQTISSEIRMEDSTIAILTDSLAALRNQYGIYDIISPSRYNIMLSQVKGNGKGDLGKGVEQIQNLESVKDEIVTDRSKHITLLNQYTTGTTGNNMPVTQVITEAKPPVHAKGLNLPLMVLTGALLGFFFSALFVLMNTYYRLISSVQR